MLCLPLGACIIRIFVLCACYFSDSAQANSHPSPKLAGGLLHLYSVSFINKRKKTPCHAETQLGKDSSWILRRFNNKLSLHFPQTGNPLMPALHCWSNNLFSSIFPIKIVIITLAQVQTLLAFGEKHLGTSTIFSLSRSTAEKANAFISMSLRTEESSDDLPRLYMQLGTPSGCPVKDRACPWDTPHILSFFDYILKI